MIIMIIANDANFELATTIKTKNQCSFFPFFFLIEWILCNIIILKKNTAPIVGEILDMWVIINITGYQEGTQVKWLADCSFVYGKCKNHKNVYKGH